LAASLKEIIAELIVPFVKFLFSKVVGFVKYLKLLGYKLIVPVVATVTIGLAIVVVNQLHQIEKSPSRPEIPFETASEEIIEDEIIDTTDLVFPELRPRPIPPRPEIPFETASEEIIEDEIIDTTPLVLPKLRPRPIPPKPEIPFETASEEIIEDEIIDTTKLVLPKLHPRPLPPPIRLRSQPKSLSRDGLKAMLKEHGFFDASLNKNSRGFDNQFKSQVISGDKVIMDQASGLMWQQAGSSNYMKYDQAKSWIKELNRKGYAGFHDWRLPTLEEVMTLIEPTKNEAGRYIDPIFDPKQYRIWTVDKVTGESWRWVVTFFNGYCNYNDLYYDIFVRCVRHGQSSGR